MLTGAVGFEDGELPGLGHVADLHVGEALVVGRDAVQEVPHAVLRRHPLRGATGQRRAVDMGVHGGQVHVLAVGRQDVVVVEVRQLAEVDPVWARVRRGQVQRPQPPVAVEDQALPVEGPVGRFEQDAVGLVDELRCRHLGATDPDLGSLAGGEHAGVSHGLSFGGCAVGGVGDAGRTDQTGSGAYQVAPWPTSLITSRRLSRLMPSAETSSTTASMACCFCWSL